MRTKTEPPGAGTPGASETESKQILRPKESPSIAQRAVAHGLNGLGYGFEPRPGVHLDLGEFPFRLKFQDGSSLLVERIALLFTDEPLPAERSN